MTEIKVYINNDVEDLPFGTSGIDFIELNPDNDILIFSAGSDIVKDGEPIPSSQQLNQAGTIITSSDVIVSKYFLADESDNLLREIYLAGNQNKRYVFCFSFDGATASEPVLEVWDNADMDTIDGYVLGEGVASASWYRGIVTTSGLPGADWVGSRLAGSADGYFLFLNDGNGALDEATDLYCQIKAIVPANFEYSGAETPILAIKYTVN